MRRYLDISELNLNKNNLAKKSLHSGIQSLLGQILSFIIMMGSTAVLARLLEPSDYGLVAIVIAITTFFTLFKDFGLSISLIQKEEITNEEIDVIFWFVVFIGIILTLVVILISFFVGSFFQDNRLVDITRVASGIFIIGSFSIIPNAILRRNMQFKKLMYIQVLASFLSALSAIYFANLGFGYWALVLNMILPVLLTTIFTLYSLRWFPKFSYSLLGIQKFIKLGKYILLFDIVNYFSRNLDNLLIAKVYSPTNLGFYSKAYQLLLLPIQQIRIPLVNVALPALSTVKNDPKLFSYYYLALSDLLNILVIPVICLMWLNANEIIYIILGEKWLYSAEIFKLLAFAALVQPILGTFGVILISLGKNKKYLYWGILNFTIIVSSFGIGVNYTLIIFIYIYILGNYLSFIISIPYILKDSPIKIMDFLKTFFIPISYFLPITYVINLFYGNDSALNLEAFSLKTLFFGISIFIFFMLFPKYKIKLFNLKQTFKQKEIR